MYCWNQSPHQKYTQTFCVSLQPLGAQSPSSLRFLPAVEGSGESPAQPQVPGMETSTRSCGGHQQRVWWPAPSCAIAWVLQVAAGLSGLEQPEIHQWWWSTNSPIGEPVVLQSWAQLPPEHGKTCRAVLLGVGLSAAWECLCSTCVHQVADTSLVFSRFFLEPSEQQHLEAAVVWHWRSTLKRLECFDSRGSEDAGLSVPITAAALSWGASGILF